MSVQITAIAYTYCYKKIHGYPEFLYAIWTSSDIIVSTNIELFSCDDFSRDLEFAEEQRARLVLCCLFPGFLWLAGMRLGRPEGGGGKNKCESAKCVVAVRAVLRPFVRSFIRSERESDQDNPFCGATGGGGNPNTRRIHYKVTPLCL